MIFLAHCLISFVGLINAQIEIILLWISILHISATLRMFSYRFIIENPKSLLIPSLITLPSRTRLKNPHLVRCSFNVKAMDVFPAPDSPVSQTTIACCGKNGSLKLLSSEMEVIKLILLVHSQFFDLRLSEDAEV